MKDVYYHSKSLMFRVGNVKRFPVEFEVGLLEAAQFAGKQYEHNDDGTSTLVTVMPHGLKSFMKAFIPKHYGGLYNVEGNHLGSWNFALNYYVDSWKFRLYLEHYFEDHSQMFWEYGRWKDGQLGVEISFPDNLWIRSFVWEGMSTKDQSGPILYDQVAGTFGCQISAGDNYYNNGNYLAWQHWGMGMGQPFLYGPAYNKDGSKVQVINKYGETTWLPIEHAKAGTVPESLSWFEPADFRPALIGEEELTNFIKIYLNIPNKSYRKKNGEVVELKDKSEAEARLDKIQDYFKGDFSELRNVIALQSKNKVKCLFGIKTTDDNKMYQAVYTQKFLRNNTTDYSKLDAEVQERKQNGAYPNTEFFIGDLKEYTVEPTNFAPSANSEEPSTTSPWFEQ